MTCALEDVNNMSTFDSFDGSIMSQPPTSSSRDEVQASPDKRRMAYDLLHLVGIFDDILIEEYSKDHDATPRLDFSTQDGHITCDFCGADIFHSFFECQDCTLSDTLPDGDTITDHKLPSGDGLVICPPCFVEGRSCGCQRMFPAQRRPFTDLLWDRAKATKMLQYLRDNGTLDSGRSILNEKCVHVICPRTISPSANIRALLSGEHLGINRAACLLHEIRMLKVRLVL
jgi:hypothetical protein